jgi:hypothetical protein
MAPIVAQQPKKHRRSKSKKRKPKELDPHKKYKFKKSLRTEEIDKAIPCPIEDPRNPFHAEYLKLKALSDGHLREASMISHAPSQNISQISQAAPYSKHTPPASISHNGDASVADYPVSRLSTTSRPPTQIRRVSTNRGTPHVHSHSKGRSGRVTIDPMTTQRIKTNTMHQHRESVKYQQAPISTKALNNGEMFGDQTPANTPSDTESQTEDQENLHPDTLSKYYQPEGYQVTQGYKKTSKP